jgi:hypothetical protein
MDNYFIAINKILTSVLSAIIGVGIILGIFFLGSSITSQDFNLVGLNFSFTIILLLANFLSLSLVAGIQNYLFHLLEKEKYTEIGKNFVAVLLINSFALFVCFVMTFLLFTQTENAGLIVLLAQTAFSLIASSVIREKANYKVILGDIVGVLFGCLIGTFAILALVDTSNFLGLIGGLSLLVITLFFTSTFEFLVAMLNKIENKSQ